MVRRKDKKRRDHPRKRHGGRSSKERFDKRSLARQSSAESERGQTPAQQAAVKKLLSGIGVPEPTAFVPDPFQDEALRLIETHDVLVTAPTGSGKTWIAREEIRRLLRDGKRAWYTTPLKALTNSKYVEFSNEFGAENVGILTGDRKENADAPLIVGTTEIYRNQIFDAMRSGTSVRTDFVILDEAHYLGDEDRGHVWEESIILTPPRIRLLMLSATVGRAQAFAEWVAEVRGTKVKVIDRAGTRPVELRAAYLSPGLRLYPLLDENGNFNSADLKRFLKEKRQRNFRRR